MTDPAAPQAAPVPFLRPPGKADAVHRPGRASSLPPRRPGQGTHRQCLRLAIRKRNPDKHGDQTGHKLTDNYGWRPVSRTEARPPSEETFRATLQGRTPDGQPATLIVTRQGMGYAGHVWLTFDGAIKTTLVLTDQEAIGLVGLVSDATGAR